MALKSALAFAVLFLFASCEAKPENCTQCKLLPVGGGFSSEFRLKASEKGVRLVYLNLKIGNDSYRPLELQDEFLPNRWVWANTFSEPLLSVVEDYDILSLGLLNFQFRSMDVQLKDQPSGCLASLNSSCQNMAVGRMLLENVTVDNTGELSHENQVVCVAVIKTDGFYNGTEYHCCSMQYGIFIRCNLTVNDNSWSATIDLIFMILSFFVAWYIPALPLTLPDCVFSLQYELDMENRAEQQISSREAGSHHMRNGYRQIGDQSEEEESEPIPVDDASPMTFSMCLFGCVQTMPDIQLSFNIKLAFMWFCAFPWLVYVQLGLYFMFRKTFINESYRKHVPVIYSFGPSSLIVSSESIIILLFVAIAFTGLILVMFLRPKDLLITSNLWQDLGIELHLPLREASPCLVGDILRHNIKKMPHSVYYLIQRLANVLIAIVVEFNSATSFDAKTNCLASRMRRALCVLWRLVAILLTLNVGIVFAAIFFIVFFPMLLAFLLVWFSPLFRVWVSLLKKAVVTFTENFSRPLKVLAWVLFCIYGLALYYVSYMLILLSCTFIFNVLGFTILGFVLNADIVTPYAAFFLAITTNIYMCYANLQNRYKEVKKMILKWEKELHINSNDPEDTIPSKLFWFVCDNVLPIKTEICLMFRNVVLILAFLFFVVFSIVHFGKQYNVSAIFSTIAVVVSGVIPALVFKGLTKENIFIGWEKIKMKREIETAVREFYQDRNSKDMEGSQLQSINNYDTAV